MVNTYIGIFLCFVKFGSPILSYKQDKEFVCKQRSSLVIVNICGLLV